MIARPPGTSSAPPMPCAARASDELIDRRRQPAPDRSQREQRHSDRINALAAQVIAERTAEQQERREQKRVRFDHPLHVDGRGLEVRLQRRQRHVDDRAVDEHHARSENRRGENPWAQLLAARRLAFLRGDYAFIAWWFEEVH